MRQINLTSCALPQHRRQLTTALTGDCAGSLRRAMQRVQTDVIGVGEGSFLAIHCAHTDPLVDVEATGFDDTFFERPTFAATVLKIQISIVEAMRHHAGEYLFNMLRLNSIRREQGVLRGSKQSVR